MRKIVLTPESGDPKVVNRSSFRYFENAQGGPYRYGQPLEFNTEVINRLHNKSQKGRTLP